MMDLPFALIVILTVIVIYYPTYTGPIIYLKTDLNGYINIDNYPEKIDRNILKTDRGHLFWSSYTSRGVPVFNTELTRDDIARVHNKYDKYYIGKDWFGDYATANTEYYFTRLTQLNLTLDNVVRIGLTNSGLLGYKEFIYNYATTVGRYNKTDRCSILNKMTHYYYPDNSFDWFVGCFLKKFAGVFRGCELNLTGDPLNRDNIIKNIDKFANYDIKIKDSIPAIYQAIMNGWECNGLTAESNDIYNNGEYVGIFNMHEFVKLFKADKRRTKKNIMSSCICFNNLFGGKEKLRYLFDLFDLYDI